MKDNEQKILNELEHNTGTQQYFKIPFSSFRFTEGINDLINKCGCWWLISDLGIELTTPKFLTNPFLIVRIEVNQDDRTALITIKEDSDKTPLYKKEIEYTDFPLKEYEFYICDGVMLLKSEY